MSKFTRTTPTPVHVIVTSLVDGNCHSNSISIVVTEADAQSPFPSFPFTSSWTPSTNIAHHHHHLPPLPRGTSDGIGKFTKGPSSITRSRLCRRQRQHRHRRRRRPPRPSLDYYWSPIDFPSPSNEPTMAATTLACPPVAWSAD